MLHAARRLWRIVGGGRSLLPVDAPRGVGARRGPGRRRGWVRDSGALLPVRPRRAARTCSSRSCCTTGSISCRWPPSRRTRSDWCATGATCRRPDSTAFGLGALYERAGWVDAAIACYRAAAEDHWQTRDLRRASARSLARLLRRQRRFEEAAVAWHLVLQLGRPSPTAPRGARSARHPPRASRRSPGGSAAARGRGGRAGDRAGRAGGLQSCVWPGSTASLREPRRRRRCGTTEGAVPPSQRLFAAMRTARRLLTPTRPSWTSRRRPCGLPPSSHRTCG